MKNHTLNPNCQNPDTPDSRINRICRYFVISVLAIFALAACDDKATQEAEAAKAAAETAIAAAKAKEAAAKEAIAKLKAAAPPAVASGGNTFTDVRDKKTYKIVTIGKQTWMAENLNYEAKGSKCYDNKKENCAKYGRLYGLSDGYVPKKACPSGWHLPTVEEWSALINFAGGYGVAEKKLKAKSGWSNGNGTDEFGFAAMAGGHRLQLPGKGGFWWQEDNSNDGKPDNVRVIGKDECNIDDCLDNSDGFSIRCVRN
jgi:uncharacterized protein (TIGR02145 family)